MCNAKMVGNKYRTACFFVFLLLTTQIGYTSRNEAGRGTMQFNICPFNVILLSRQRTPVDLKDQVSPLSKGNLEVPRVIIML